MRTSRFVLSLMFGFVVLGLASPVYAQEAAAGAADSGLVQWSIITAVSGGVAAAAWLMGFPWAVVPVFVVWLALVAFFRDPLGRRPATTNPNDMVSPADGRISAIVDVEHHSPIGGPGRVIRIFLSVLDVHLKGEGAAAAAE